MLTGKRPDYFNRMLSKGREIGKNFKTNKFNQLKKAAVFLVANLFIYLFCTQVPSAVAKRVLAEFAKGHAKEVCASSVIDRS